MSSCVRSDAHVAGTAGPDPQALTARRRWPFRVRLLAD
jgi:hypothetical protein